MKQQSLINITHEFYERLRNYDQDSPIAKITPLSEHLIKTYQLIAELQDNRIFFGDIKDSLEITEIDYNTCMVMKVIAIVSEEIKQTSSDTSDLPEIIKKTADKFDLPGWLKERMISYIPLLVEKDYNLEFSGKKTPSEFIIIKKGKILSYNVEELTQFKNQNKPESFDIYIENTDNVFISVLGNPNMFRAGNYHPFNIITLFLQRHGCTITYREVYQLAIKPFESTPPRDYSKKVYDYLKIINNNIENTYNDNVETDSWFKKGKKPGTIQISDTLNSCLITTREYLFI